MGTQANRGLPDFRQARHPTRVYSGVHEDTEPVIHVFDSSLPESESNPRRLLPDASRGVQDYCDHFSWGTVDAGASQLAVALLLNVSEDMATASKWHQQFLHKYVRQLPATWTVPELDIALWLHCFENAPPDA